MRLSIPTCIAVLALTGCATVGIQPGPGATRVAGDENAAFAVASNVNVTVRTDAWNGGPADLERVLTPLEVTIENNSGQPLRVRYQDFGLVGEGGFRYAAIPPFATEQAKQSKVVPVVPREPEPGRFVLAMAEGGVHAASPVPAAPPPSGPPPSAGTGPVPLHQMTPLSRPPPAMVPPVQTAPRAQAERFITPGAPMSSAQVGGVHGATPVRPRDPVVISRPRFYYRDFYVSPLYGPFYPGLGVWSGPFMWDPFYNNRYYSSWSQPLPSRDMLEVALPEGVLESGGKVSGFVYFTNVRGRENNVAFTMDLVNARSNEPLGSVRIPLQVVR